MPPAPWRRYQRHTRLYLVVIVVKIATVRTDLVCPVAADDHVVIAERTAEQYARVLRSVEPHSQLSAAQIFAVPVLNKLATDCI